MSENEPPAFYELSEQLARLAKLIDATNADLRWCLDTVKKDYGITDEELKGEKTD